jgi:vacuolar protein sorting-associated protein 72
MTWMLQASGFSAIRITMRPDDVSNPSSPSPSNSDSDSSGSSSSLPEALVHGREKRATAGNKLRALLDAEFQEEEIFKEDEDDEEFERQKSDQGEEFLSESESSGDEGQDEEEGERALLAEQKSDAKRTREKKRKANETFVKPIAKRRTPVRKENVGILASKPASTTSSTSQQRRISSNQALQAARRSSRALTVQTTNETHSRIVSAAARRATMPAIPRREQTPPLTQEERLAQAILTEEENKMSLKRIVEAEEERSKKRREKLEALRRRRFDEPILRFISRRESLIEEIPTGEEDNIDVGDTENEETDVTGIKQEALETAANKPAPDDNRTLGERPLAEKPTEELNADKMDIDGHSADKPLDQDTTRDDTQSQNAPSPSIQSDQDAGSAASPLEREEMDADKEELSQNPRIDANESNSRDVNESPNEGASVPKESGHGESRDKEGGDAETPIPEPDVHSPKSEHEMKEATQGDISPTTDHTTSSPAKLANCTTATIISASTSASLPKPLLDRILSPPATPLAYEEAHFTANTLSMIPLPGQPLKPTREAFFPTVPLVAPPKPKPSARCPITGLPARYKDPYSGVGYYDIHAFKILREVGRPGGRYVWCSEGGWFVGETGWGGRGAKGVPEGWNG